MRRGDRRPAPPKAVSEFVAEGERNDWVVTERIEIEVAVRARREIAEAE